MMLMSTMLKKLDDVECRPLEMCCEILDKKRKPITKAARESGKYPYYGANGVQDYVSGYIFDGVFILVGEDGSVITSSGTPIVTWAEGKIWVNNHAHIISQIDGVNLRYLFHYLQTVNVTPLIHGNIPKLTGKDFRAIPVPLPPFPIQQEIVRILDTFTNLTAELTDKLNAELTARRKQYEYYRDELLKTGEQVSLYEVAQYSKDRILASELTDENYVGVDNLLPNKQGKIKSEHTPIEGKFTGFVKGDILIGNIRPYLKKIWFSDCVGGTNGDVLTIRVIDKERVLPRFLYFALSTESFFNYDMNNAKGAKMPRGDKNAVMKYQFYLPSLEIQEQVVSILEIFDNLCNGLECGLPAEIYARQQQYEYYRDKLLNFKELHNKED